MIPRRTTHQCSAPSISNHQHELSFCSGASRIWRRLRPLELRALVERNSETSNTICGPTDGGSASRPQRANPSWQARSPFLDAGARHVDRHSAPKQQSRIKEREQAQPVTLPSTSRRVDWFAAQSARARRFRVPESSMTHNRNVERRADVRLAAVDARSVVGWIATTPWQYRF
jgi:hypothetical protein